MGIVSSKRKFIIALAILIVAQLAAYTFLGFQKQDYHIDEYSTYQYANSDSIWWSIPQGEWTSPDYLLKQMLVDSPRRNFSMVISSGNRRTICTRSCTPGRSTPSAPSGREKNSRPGRGLR